MSDGSTGTLLVAGLSDGLGPALLERAAQIAGALGLRVYLHCPLADRITATPLPGLPAALMPGTAAAAQAPEARELWRKRRSDELGNAIAALRARRVEADGRVEWKHSRVAAVLDEIEARSASLVMTAATPQGRLADLLGPHDDIELIRLCPRPLWLVENPHAHRGVVLAAVDPTHEDDRASAVDHAVLGQAAELACRLGKQAHAVHTYTLPTRLPGVIETAAPDIVEDRYRCADDARTRRMHELTREHGIRAEHVHVINGELVETLESLTRTLEVDVIVTGALSRSRLKRRLIGGTAERLLRTIDTDVLVVKAHGGLTDAGKPAA